MRQTTRRSMRRTRDARRERFCVFWRVSPVLDAAPGRENSYAQIGSNWCDGDRRCDPLGLSNLAEVVSRKRIHFPGQGPRGGWKAGDARKCCGRAQEAWATGSAAMRGRRDLSSLTSDRRGEAGFGWRAMASAHAACRQPLQPCLRPRVLADRDIEAHPRRAFEMRAKYGAGRQHDARALRGFSELQRIGNVREAAPNEHAVVCAWIDQRSLGHVTLVRVSATPHNRPATAPSRACLPTFASPSAPFSSNAPWGP